VVRGDNVFGTTVSKSFSKTDEKKGKKVVTVSISVASYRVVQVSLILWNACITVNHKKGSLQNVRLPIICMKHLSHSLSFLAFP